MSLIHMPLLKPKRACGDSPEDAAELKHFSLAITHEELKYFSQTVFCRQTQMMDLLILSMHVPGTGILKWNGAIIYAINYTRLTRVAALTTRLF